MMSRHTCGQYIRLPDGKYVAPSCLVTPSQPVHAPAFDIAAPCPMGNANQLLTQLVAQRLEPTHCERCRDTSQGAHNWMLATTRERSDMDADLKQCTWRQWHQQDT